MGKGTVFDPTGLACLLCGLFRAGGITHLKGLCITVGAHGIPALFADKDAHERFLDQSHQFVL
eukprot:NODE_7531_length_562_cov_4.025341_g6508_i0.p2 GENE.NODE_7531_length_562_cov_4.025341_g6508_i0~~NODE_7531_length_562_cov_4.025341_g6508_i0.p2  ORF type:complete len:63 (-),score=3.18 NODE_7531_length_562_cov_4.025341_g6508_i0:53-241(-)